MYALFPFSKVKRGASVVLYGMGKNGRELYRQIWATQYCHIKYAVDNNWKNIRHAGIDIYPPEKLKQERNVPIIITIAGLSVCQKIRQMLIDFGIHEENIICENLYIQEMDHDLSFWRRMESIRHLLHIKETVGKNLVRVGGENDGGYIMLDDFAESGIAYSFGISNDVAWDDAMADMGYNIFMYDHTIKDLPKQRRSFHFFKQGISNVTDSSLLLDTLENYITQNGHIKQKNLILKMDVEGDEWKVFDNVPSNIMEQFDQMVIEIHGRVDGKWEDLEHIIYILKKIDTTHQVIHVHANNACVPLWDDQRPWPYAFEVTYAKRSKYVFAEPDSLYLPIAIDSPCNPNADELRLGEWNRWD